MTNRLVGRRGLLLAAVTMPALTACRVRLEDDAPRVPLLPTREPIADETSLVALLAELRWLTAAAGSVRPAQPSVAAAHRAQVEVVDSILRRSGVPAGVVSPTPTATGSTAPAPATTVASLAALEAHGLAPAALATLAGLTTPYAAQARSIAAHRAVVATGLGAKIAWPAPDAEPAAPLTTASPTATASPTPSPDTTDAALLAAFRSAGYALEVAAARSGTQAQAASDPKTTQRTLLLADAEWAAGHSRTLVARLGEDAPAPPLGYPLPFPVDSPAAAKRLAAQAFSRLELAVGDTLTTATGPSSTVAVHALVDVLQRGARWGLTLRPFPGLVTSAATPSVATSPTAT